MSEHRLTRWTSAAALLVCATVGLSMLLEQLAAPIDTLGPTWLWWAAYLAYLTVLVLVDRDGVWPGWLAPPRNLALLTVLGWAVVMSARGFGLSEVLLVFTVAILAQEVARTTTVAVIAVQTGVVAAAMGIAGAPWRQTTMVALFYGVLQTLVALAAWAEQRAARTREQLATTNVELQAATALLDESARAKERLRIARELHDLVGHQLSVLALELEVAAHRAEGPAAEHVERARSVAKQLLADVRTAVGELRDKPPALREALERLTTDLDRPQVHLTVDDDLDLDEETAVALIRCGQEVVTNAIRHADADNLWLEATETPDGGVALHGRDDGRGASALQPGHGLTGLRERVEALGGEVRVDGQDGFTVSAWVPASRATAAVQGPT